MVLSVDPGLWKTGCALWTEQGALIRGWTVKRPKDGSDGADGWRRMALAIDVDSPAVLVLERMQVDGRTRGKERGMFDLCGVLGAVSMRYKNAQVVCYTPRQWKGTVPKKIMRGRIEGRLTEEERALVDPKATHDAWDAIGIGQHYFNMRNEE